MDYSMCIHMVDFGSLSTPFQRVHGASARSKTALTNHGGSF